MKILPRNILKEFTGNLLLGLFIFTFVLLLDHLFELVDLLLNKGAGLFLTAQLLFLLLPSSLSLTLPMSSLLSSLLTYGRLSENNEITAIKASGLPTWSFLQAPAIAALLAVFFLIPFNTIWAPHAQSRFRQLYLQILQANPLIHIEPRIFLEVGDYHIYIEKKDKHSNIMTGVTIYKTPTEGAPLRIFAQTGEATVDTRQGMILNLKNGRIAQIDPSKPSEWYYTGFTTYQLMIPVEGNQQTDARAIEEMDNKELQQQIHEHKEKGLPYLAYICQKHLRLALALTPLLFVLLGTPLAIRVQRGGRSIGFGISLVIVAAYYVLLMSGAEIGTKGLCPPWLSVWTANTVVAVMAGTLLWRFSRR